MPTNQPKVALPLRVPPEYIDRLDVLAERMQLDRSEVARRALRNGIGELETFSKVATSPVADTLLRLVTVLESDPEEREEIRRVLSAMGEHKKAAKRRRKGAST